MNNFFMPTRRECIKSAAPLIMGAAVLSAMPRAASSAVLGGSANIPGLMPSQPGIAKTWGFNTPVFWDDFNSIATIDVNNTLAPGYKWYMTNTKIPQDSPDGTQAAGVTQAPSSVSVANSVLTFTPSAGSGGWLTTTGYTGNSGTRYVGQPIAATGGYFEAKFSYNPNFTPAASFSFPFQYWPGFWIEDINLWLSINDGVAAGRNLAELDFFEGFGGSGQSNTAFEVHDWTDNIHSVQLNNGQPNLGSPNFNNMNTFGTLWVPQSKNGGTGLVQRFFNGTHLTSADVTYSSSTTSPEADGGFTGVFSDLDTSVGYALQIGSGHNWPINIDYVMVWQ